LKGIILHGGHGTRLRPLTHTGPKQLLEIANKPMSQYALEDLKNAGIVDIAIIIGDVYPEKVKEFYGNGKKFGVKITYIYQDKPKGISHAIGLCRDFVGNDRFVVYLGDNILRKDLNDYVSKFSSSSDDAMILFCEVENPSSFGVGKFENNKLVKIIEKPKIPPSKFAVIGIYFFTPLLFDIIEQLKPSWRGELEIVDALQILLEKNYKISYDFVTGWWKDTGTPEDILHANRLILDSIGCENQFLIGKNYKINGNIVLGENTEISRDCHITGPIIIGDNCKIGPNVRVGPYVSVGDNCRLKQCTIENSIIMSDCLIDANVDLSESIVAKGSTIENNSKPKKHEFLLGERSHLKL